MSARVIHPKEVVDAVHSIVATLNHRLKVVNSCSHYKITGSNRVVLYRYRSTRAGPYWTFKQFLEEKAQVK